MPVDIEKAQSVIQNGLNEAQELLKNPAKLDELLRQLEEKLKEVPLAGELLADVPKMIAMVKAYITKDYTKVSVKVIASLVAAFIYLVKREDLIPDNVPVLGYVDDLAILAAALKLSEPELKEFDAWRSGSASI